MAATQADLQKAMAANAAIESIWNAEGIPIIQQVDNQNPVYVTGQTPAQVVTLKAAATGLIRKFYLVMKGTIVVSNTASAAATKNFIGVPNLASNITFVDSSTRVRHNTSGWHMHLMGAVRRGFPAGAALTASAMSDNSGFGNLGYCNVAPASVGNNSSANFQWVFEIPVTVTDTDLRGAIWANQVAANNLVQVTLNPNFFIQNTAADASAAGYTTATAVNNNDYKINNLVLTLYQDMLLPPPSFGQNVQIPLVDVSYAYAFTRVPAQGIQANSDNVFFLPPNRSFLSQIVEWDNVGYTGAIGSDVTSIKIQVANSLVMRQMDPGILAYWTRNQIETDMPAGNAAGTGTKTDYTTYLIDTRRRPLNVMTGGNVGLYFNPSVVQSANSQLFIDYEYTELQAATFNAPGFGG